jgi:hypothetical protein
MTAPPGASVAAAVAAANRATLAELVPSEKSAIDSAYQTVIDRIPDGQPKLDGIAIGEKAALISRYLPSFRRCNPYRQDRSLRGLRYPRPLHAASAALAMRSAPTLLAGAAVPAPPARSPVLSAIAAPTPGFMLSTIELGTKIVVPRSLVVS